MAIYLGNLSVNEIENRVGVKFSNEAVERLTLTRQERAKNIGENEWHCFDIPFMLVCGSTEFAREIFGLIGQHADDFKTPMEMSVSALKSEV
jgi:hypothetical protein